MSKLASVIKEIKKIASENDDKSIDDIVNEAKKHFDVDDVYEIRDVTLTALVEQVKDSPELYVEPRDEWYDSMNEYVYQLSSNWCEENGYDEREDYDDLVSEIDSVVSESVNMDVNYEFTTVLLRTEYELAGDDFAVTCDGLDDAGILAAFDAEPISAPVRAAGFTDKQILEVLHANNNGYPGIIYLGILSDDAVSDLMLNDNPTGTPIFVTHDFYNGAGEFVEGNGTISTTINSGKEFYERLDFGSRSLGAVFGGAGWTFK